MDEIILEFASSFEYLHLASTLTKEVCKTINNPKLDRDFLTSVELAVSEACTNAIKHGGTNQGKRVVLSFQISNDRLVINVKDQGPGFDITKVPVPDFDSHPAGGYGIYIIKTMMDKVEHVRENNWNILTMTKYFKDKERHKSADQEGD
jgi:serine/threonine-protein kinase RsbW